jgi:branched-chain amino acid transport system ATP-binding protein
VPDTTPDQTPDPTAAKAEDTTPPTGPRVDDQATERAESVDTTPDTSVDISVPEIATLPKGKMREVDDVTLRFGGVTALDGVSFHINTGEILGLIGPNGAGKTTCFNVMTGVYQPTSGGVRFMGEPLGKRKKYQITKLGIARTFQNIRLFHNMTALENVLVGADAHHSTGMGSALLRLPKHHAEESEGEDRAYELLKFMGLEKRANELARNLPYGDQRRLEIARALATNPKLLCLDEPAAGFNPAEKARLMELIQTIRDQGYTVLLIEHDMKLVMGVTDRIVVLEFGKKIAEGSPAEIRDNPAVIAAYLGVDEEDAS